MDKIENSRKIWFFFFKSLIYVRYLEFIYVSLFYLLMYFDVCQNEILIKCHAVRNKLERQYSNSDEWSDIRPDFYFWANLTLKIGNRAWTVKNWNFHNCCTTQFAASSLFSSISSCKKSHFYEVLLLLVLLDFLASPSWQHISWRGFMPMASLLPFNFKLFIHWILTEADYQTTKLNF